MEHESDSDSTLGKVPKGLEKRVEVLDNRGRIETIPTNALLRSSWILEENWFHLDSTERSQAISSQKNLQWVK